MRDTVFQEGDVIWAYGAYGETPALWVGIVIGFELELTSLYTIHWLFPKNQGGWMQVDHEFAGLYTREEL